MKKFIFISYRRDDTALVARALAETLRYRLGADKVFLDEDSLRYGEIWSNRLENAVSQATVVLALIGPNWLTASDEYGRRRLDKENDWVRKELLFAHQEQERIKIIPLLIGKDTSMPPTEGLPDALSWLSSIEKKTLHNDTWNEDVTSIVNTIVNEHKFVDIQREPVLPEPGTQKRYEPPLSEKVLDQELEKLEGWEPVERMYPPRREIRKVYHFNSFKAAVDFMAKAVPSIEKEPVHHPRWENQYKAVTVYFSTWDAGSKITNYDISAAKKMDKIYESFEGKHNDRE
jgi:pterin-4a-carbinolamine dehydratase